MLAPQLQAAVAAGAHEAAAWSFFRRLQMLAAQAAKLNKQYLERSKADAERKRLAPEVSYLTLSALQAISLDKVTYMSKHPRADWLADQVCCYPFRLPKDLRCINVEPNAAKVRPLTWVQGRDASAATKEAPGSNTPEKKLLLRRTTDGPQTRSGAQSPQPPSQASASTPAAGHAPQTPQQLLLEVQSVLRKGVPALSQLGASGAIAGVAAFCRAAFGPVAHHVTM